MPEVTPKETSRSGECASLDRPLADLVSGIPKAEIHLHIEGTLEPKMLLDLARRNSVKLPQSAAEAARSDYRFFGLQHFLELYYAAVTVLVGEQDFHDLTTAYLARAAADHVKHVEVFFDPQCHLARGLRFDDVVAGITRALDDAEAAAGISWRLIMCFLRDQPVRSALETLERALPYRDVIAGVGLDSAEAGHPPREFADVFARAREAGFQAVAHAGEEGPAEYIAEALDVLRVARIDHGVRAIDDPELQARLAAEQIPLTMCPLSNLRLQVTPDLTQHPLKRLLDAGLCVTVNSDDPAYFGGYVGANYAAAQRALGLTRTDIVRLARNSITASWLPAPRRALLLAEIDSFAAHAAIGEDDTVLT